MAIDDKSVTPEELPAIVETAEWVEHLPAFVKDMLLWAGEDGEGSDNFQARVFDARTRWLKEVVDGLTTGEYSGVILKELLNTEEELAAIPTEGLRVGTAHFLNWEMRMWNGDKWETSGSLRGDRGINLLGVWPNAVPLPSYTQNTIGDAYIWQNDIWVLAPAFDYYDPVEPDAPPRWEALNIRGPDGLSTFDLWKTVPGNENKTLNQFLAAQKGDKGDDAYQTWLTIPGNKDKSMAEWVEDTRGPRGFQGDPRPAFTVQGNKANTAALPNPGIESEAWYIGIDLYVWVDRTQSWFIVPGVKGRSAYEDWLTLDEDNEGKTLAQFIDSLKSTVPGPRGLPGNNGIDGRNLRVLGSVGRQIDLNQIKDPVDQDAYCVLETGNLWMYLPLDGGWKDLGPWRGMDGKSALEVWQDNGNPEGTAAQFFASLRGKDGVNMTLRGVVATKNALPASPQEQWLYAVKDENSFYMYLEGAWAHLGTYGKDGINGVDGKSLDIIKILTADDQTPPPANASTKGKAYISYGLPDALGITIRDVYCNVSGTAWEYAGRFQPPGERGAAGVAFRPKGTVATVADLPKFIGDNKPQEGDSYVVLGQNKGMYTVVDGAWSGPTDLVGPQGEQGIQGIPGALMPILGTYRTMALLRTAHPTGSIGDAYMIIDPNATPDPIRNLAIWSPEQNDWVDTGPAGVKGEQGIQGIPGKDSIVPGPVGSQWLTLATQDAPSNAFNGRVGDWAVNQLMHVYYKTAGGWIFWGILVAGDVNSPMQTQGKVVRYGNAWVPVPVDEVQNPEVGKFYGRTIVGEDVGGDPVLDWREIKSIADLSAKDGKQYVRVFLTNGTVPVWQELVIKIDRYDLPIKSLAASATIDPKVDQVIALNNSTTAAKTLTLADGPKGASVRAQTLMITIAGSAGIVTFASTGGTVLEWDTGTPPTMSGRLTNIILWWTGTQWLGMKGAVVPT